jgi:hypothetical protein
VRLGGTLSIAAPAARRPGAQFPCEGTTTDETPTLTEADVRRVAREEIDAWMDNVRRMVEEDSGGEG